MKCPKCQRETFDKTRFCGWCGADMRNPFQDSVPPPNEMSNKELNASKADDKNVFNTRNFFGEGKKSKLVAGLLGIFVGGLGIHNFYLGFNSRGLIQLLMSTVGSFTIIAPIFSWLWGFIEGIQIISASKPVDSKGNVLQD
jgi:TM2 domain-containing membrane protein YozV